MAIRMRAMRAMASLLVVAGCGSSQPEGTPLPGTTAANPAPSEPELSSHLDDDGWRRWELPLEWPTPPERHTVPMPSRDDDLSELVRLRSENLARGVADPRGASLHDVSIPRRVLGARSRSFTVRALVVPETRGGVRFAILGGALWPIDGLGPALDLAAECGAALDLAAQDDWSEAGAHCPLDAAWPIFLELPDPSLAARWAALADVVAHEAFLAQERLDTLRERGVASFAQGDDAQAERDLTAAAALEEQGVDLPVQTAVMRAQPPGLQLSAELLAQVRGEARARQSVPQITEGDEDLVRALGEITTGFAELAEAPEIQAVVARGEPIVPTLLSALDDEQATTRSFQIGLRRRVSVVPRYEAVWIALTTILDHEVIVPGTLSDHLFMNTPGARERAREGLRRYWSEHGTQNAAERRDAVLRDEQASLDERAVAAVWIASSGPTPRHFRAAPSVHLPGAWPADLGPPQGESLRSRSDPSVTDLLATLLHAALTSDETRDAGCDLAWAGARWDAAGFAARGSDDLRTMAGDSMFFCQASVASAFGAILPQLPLEVLRSAPDGMLTSGEEALHERVALWSADRAFRAELTRAYARTSALAAMPRMPTAAALARRGVLPARQWLLGWLADRHEGGTLSARSGSGWLATPSFSITVDVASAPSTPTSVRRCDVAASQVSHTLDVPFDLSSPEVDRDAAIERMRDALSATTP